MEFIRINLLLLLLSDALAGSAASVANVTQVNFEQTLAATLAAEEEEGGGWEKKLLSRKRRYLLFPEGSSFQLVYDEIIGVVDYTNYLILGITVALAWELPSKPPSEQLEDLRTRLKDGTLGLSRNDTIDRITYIDTQNISLSQTPSAKQSVAHAYENSMPTFHAPMHPQYYYHYTPKTHGGRGQTPAQPHYYGSSFIAQNRDFNGASYSGQNYRPWRRRNYYYSKRTNPFEISTSARQNNYDFTEARKKYPWWKLATRLSNSLAGKPRPAAIATGRSNSNTRTTTATRRRSRMEKLHQQQTQQETGYYRSTPTRKHRIFPVFGKRSVATLENSGSSTSRSASSGPSSPTAAHVRHVRQQQHHRQRRSGIIGQQLSKLDRIHIRHHRSTRQELYEKIERYLDKRGSDGNHCVLRALCETGQKSHERAPGSFVGELMRAVFTLPEPVEQHEMNDGERTRWDPVHHKQNHYDAANAFAGDCAVRYQLCKDSLWMSEFVA